MHQLWGFRARCRSLWGGERLAARRWGREGCRGWLCWQGCCERSINAAASIHPWIHVFSLPLPLSLSIYMCIYIYIFLSFLLTFFFFYFFHSSLFFSPLILSRSFFPHTCLLSRKFIVSLFLSRCLEFVSIHQFVFSSIAFFFSFLFFIKTVSRGLFFFYLCRSRTWLLQFSSRSIPRVPNGFSDSFY